MANLWGGEADLLVWYNGHFGAANGLAFCLGVPLLFGSYGSGAASPHEAALGGMAIAMLLGELVWYLAFHQLFVEVADDGSDSGVYCVIATALSIACCSLSMLYGHVTSSFTGRSVKQRKTTMSLYAVVGFVFLLVLFFSAFNGFSTTEFSGIGIVGYFTAGALCTESVMEFLPCFFAVVNFALGWTLTVLAWQESKSALRSIVTYFYERNKAVTTNASATTIVLGASAASQLFLLVLVWWIPENKNIQRPDDCAPWQSEVE
ncbi:hypothetical protein AAVH_06697 [Aphelenchoides avenae]|nr:hypothetical protein AAVH_06697 [Aphelenchus avenae]